MTPQPDDLARIHAAAFGTTRTWSAQEYADLIAMKGVILIGDVRSFLLGRVIMDEAEVLMVATDPKFQRQGLARHRLLAFLDQASQATAQTAFLEVADDNEAAKSLYLHEGFAVTGTRPAYYDRADGRKVAAVLMQKALK